MNTENPPFIVAFSTHLDHAQHGRVDGARVKILFDLPGFANGYRFRPLRNVAAPDATEPAYVETCAELFVADANPTESRAADDIAEFLTNPPAFAAPAPQEVTRRQLWLALNAMGITRADVKAQLAGNELALIELEEAQAYLRNNPLVQMFGASLGFTSAEIDGIFIKAAKL